MAATTSFSGIVKQACQLHKTKTRWEFATLNEVFRGNSNRVANRTSKAPGIATGAAGDTRPYSDRLGWYYALYYYYCEAAKESIMCKEKLNLIAAACENLGIGINGNLPWRLKKEMAYFTNMTSQVKDNAKKNAVIMGRRTWDCIPLKFKPLDNRVNIVLTHHIDAVKPKVPDGVIVVSGLDEAISYIDSRSDIERTWVIGGSSIYKAAMEHPNCGKIYLTEIQKSFECDTFFPNIDKDKFKAVVLSEVPSEKQVEGDIEYYYKVYEKS